MSSSALNRAQLAQEIVGVRLYPFLDKAAFVGVAEDVDQLPLHSLAVRLDGADRRIRELLVEAASHHRTGGDEVAVNEDLRPADREIGEALAQCGEVRLDLVAVESARG